MSSLAFDVRQFADRVVIESGHFYSVRGPSVWSQVGWKILNNIKKEGDRTILFVDDIHPITDVNKLERNLPRVPFNPKPDFIIKESELFNEGFEALEILKTLSKRKKARFNGNGVKKWHCSSISLTHQDGSPTCTLLDVGLSLRKHRMGFSHAVNILPEFYEEQQRGTLRLVQKIMQKLDVDFGLEVILFSLNGKFRRISM